MKKQARREAAETPVYQHLVREEGAVENSKRRHMMSLISGNIKFFERILTMKRLQDPTFISKSSARNR